MINRKNFRLAPRNVARVGLISILVGSSMLGCSSTGGMLEPDRLDYKSASKAAAVNLEIPPDLTQLQRDNRYAVPDANRGVATASDFKSRQTVQPVGAGNVVIAPSTVGDIHVERDSNQRWLVVKSTPEALWPQIKLFWQDSGFSMKLETPESGIMETDWAESRLQVTGGGIQRLLDKAVSSLRDTGLRDKYRTRLERREDGSTEIYISHRGATEEIVGTSVDRFTTTKWTTRPSDPGLEAEALSRLMVRLGAQSEKAKEAMASAKQPPSRAKLVKADSGSYVEDDEEFDRAWRRVGLALDRVGFTVEDRDRAQGVYFVRYVSQDTDKESEGFFSKLFSSSDDQSKSAQRYRVSVKGVGAATQISVLNNEGRPEISKTADQILSLLTEQLK